jgi:GAF domain-containing protein
MSSSATPQPVNLAGVETDFFFSYTEWRVSFLNLILRGACVVGLLVTVAASLSVPAFLAALYIGAYITVLILAFAPLPYRIRAIGFLLVLEVIAISNLLETGIRVDARLFLMTMTIMATMLFGVRGGVIAGAAGLVTIAVAGFFILTGRYTISSVTVQIGDVPSWIVYALVLVMLETVCVLGLTLLQRGFDTALEQSRRMFGVMQAERASLEQRVVARTEQLQASAEVGRAAVSILDTDQLLREIVNLITDRFGFYYAAVFLADNTNKWAVLREATGNAGRVLKERQHRLEVGGQSMVGSVIQTRKSRIALDVGDEAVRFANPLLPDTRSEIALPLMVGSRVIGVLDVQSTQMAAFDATSAAVLQSMADQIAIALSNTMLFQQTQAGLQRTRQLYEASTAISNAADARGILQELMTKGVPEAAAAQILTYGPRDEAGHYAYYEVAASWSHTSDERLLPVGTRTGPDQVPPVPALASEPFLIRDAADPALSPEQQQMLQAMGMRALLGYALVAGSQPVGLLLMVYREPRQFTPAETQPLQALTGQVAVTLRNQQLVREEANAVKQLDEINRRLTGQAWNEYAHATGAVMHQEDAGPTADTNSEIAPIVLTAPITIHGEEVGILRLEDADPDREWTRNEQALIQAVAGEVAIAIENARLIEQTERRAQREQTISAITSQIYAATDVRKLLQITAEELRRATGSARAVVKLGRADLQADGSIIQPVPSNDGDTIPSEDGD